MMMKFEGNCIWDYAMRERRTPIDDDDDDDDLQALPAQTMQ